jgi:hypothetical protein
VRAVNLKVRDWPILEDGWQAVGRVGEEAWKRVFDGQPLFFDIETMIYVEIWRKVAVWRPKEQT